MNATMTALLVVANIVMIAPFLVLSVWHPGPFNQNLVNLLFFPPVTIVLVVDALALYFHRKRKNDLKKDHESPVSWKALLLALIVFGLVCFAWFKLGGLKLPEFSAPSVNLQPEIQIPVNDQY